MAQNSILDTLKKQYTSGGMHIRLIAWNLVFFLIIQIGVYLSRDSYVAEVWLSRIFALQSNFGAFIRSPWGLITSIFSHFDFMHFLFNMIFLYFSGQMFLQFFSGKRLLYTYIFGGLLGGIVQIIVGFFPQYFLDSGALVVGASGSIMAIFIALAIHQPQMKIYLFGAIKMPIFVLGIFFIGKDLMSIGSGDGIAHFVHLGGALFGFLSVRQYPSSKNLLTQIIKKSEKIIDSLPLSFNKKKLRKVSNPAPAHKMTDEKFNENKQLTQEEVDAILDKIGRSGYDSLTKKEKEFLFKQSGR